MPDIEARIMLPVDNRIVTAELDDTMTADEIINELIAGNVIQPSEAGYKLAVKGGAELNSAMRLRDASLTADDILRVIPATDAG